MAPGPVELSGRLDSGRLDRLHRDSLHPSTGRAGQHLADVQLCDRSRWRGGALLRRLLAPVGQELVQGATRPGFAGGVGQDRSRARGGRSRGGGRGGPIDRPRIAITTSPRRGAEYYVPYRRAVEAAGAEPVELPPGTQALPSVDGLLLPGGWDVDPSFYGEKKDEKVGPIDRELDETEVRLFRQARAQEIPVL